MEVTLSCNDCHQIWTIDDTDSVEMIPNDGTYKSAKIKFNFGIVTKNLSSCPNCGSHNTKQI